MTDTATPLNRQELFNQAVEHLFKQGKPSARLEEGGVVCLYRTADSGKLADGCGCAIGALVPDDAYDEQYENHGAFSAYEAMVGVDLSFADAKFLTDMQIAIHDLIAETLSDEDMPRLATDAEFMERLPTAVRTFAERKGLTVPEVAR